MMVSFAELINNSKSVRRCNEYATRVSIKLYVGIRMNLDAHKYFL